MKKKSLKTMSLKTKTNISGYMFMLPWIIGAIWFFIIPFLESARYAFSEVSLGAEGLDFKFVGFSNFKYLLMVNADYNTTIVSSLKDLASNVPLIWFFSLFIAILMNQKFVGRTFMRAVFFLPVIIGTGMVLRIINSDVFVTAGMEENSQIFQANALESILTQMNVGPEISEFLVKATSQVFDLSWKSGLQILLYLSSLQTIPQTYYEVASVEGANAWDTFWKITFPVLSPTSLLVVVYTIIDTFTVSNNGVMRFIIARIDGFLYGYASAAALLFFALIAIVLLLVLLISRKAVRANNA